MESYRGKKYLVLLSLVFCLSVNLFADDFLLSTDSSNLVDGDCRINIGLVSNKLSNNSNFFSINKLLSHNIIFTSSFLKNSSSKDNIFIQNSFLIKSSSNTFNFQLINNYFFSGSYINNWKSIGGNYFFVFKKIIFSIGTYFSLFEKNNTMINNSINIERKISKNISLNYSFINSKNINSNILKLSFNL